MAEKKYHHGDLREALLNSALAEIIENGPDQFSLRKCAKRAGVSHAAPAHHFQDSAHLLRALAARGFAQLADDMQDAAKAAKSEHDSPITAASIAYLDFADQNRELMALMFAHRTFESQDDALETNADRLLSAFASAMSKSESQTIFKTDDGWRKVTAIWSLVHGYAELAGAGRMRYATRADKEQQNGFIAETVGKLIRD